MHFQIAFNRSLNAINLYSFHEFINIFQSKYWRILDTIPAMNVCLFVFLFRFYFLNRIILIVLLNIYTTCEIETEARFLLHHISVSMTFVSSFPMRFDLPPNCQKSSLWLLLKEVRSVWWNDINSRKSPLQKRTKTKYIGSTDFGISRRVSLKNACICFLLCISNAMETHCSNDETKRNETKLIFIPN